MPANWTAGNMPDLTGKVAIVTGANSGIGYEMARALARQQATVILACRNQDKGAAAVRQIALEHPTAKAELMPLDLSDLAAVRRFADEFARHYQRLDLLINNAGIMEIPFGKTADGFELQFGTNHLGHFALTGLLLDLSLHTPQARRPRQSSLRLTAAITASCISLAERQASSTARASARMAGSWTSKVSFDMSGLLES